MDDICFLITHQLPLCVGVIHIFALLVEDASLFQKRVIIAILFLFLHMAHYDLLGDYVDSMLEMTHGVL